MEHSFSIWTLLESIIIDLLIFSLLALIGEIISFVIKLIIRVQKEKDAILKNEEAVERAISKTSGRV